jgi:DNA replication protein DnaC
MQRIMFSNPFLDAVKLIETKVCPNCEREYEVKEITLKNGRKIITDDCFTCQIEKENRDIAKEAKQQFHRIKNKIFDEISHVPLGVENATFDNYTPNNDSQQKALNISLEFANGTLDKSTLFFQGDTGLGKSHLSHATYKKFKDEGKTAIFVDLPSLLTTIRSTFNKNDRFTKEKILDLVSECELLVLDDVGAEYVKPDANGYESWAADILFQVVNVRQGKKTIYTTNFNSKQLSQKYGMMSKRIISRMMNNAKVIKIEGQDHRLKGLD